MTVTTCALVGQLSSEQLQDKAPDRARTLAELAGHTGSIMRAFLAVYDAESYDEALEYPAKPIDTNAGIVALLRETQERFGRLVAAARFRRSAGSGGGAPWGMRTLHEVFERAVSYPLQHTRQLAMFVERLGLAPAGRLRADELSGLPLPAGVHAGGEDG